MADAYWWRTHRERALTAGKMNFPASRATIGLGYLPQVWDASFPYARAASHTRGQLPIREGRAIVAFPQSGVSLLVGNSQRGWPAGPSMQGHIPIVDQYLHDRYGSSSRSTIGTGAHRAHTYRGIECHDRCGSSSRSTIGVGWQLPIREGSFPYARAASHTRGQSYRCFSTIWRKLIGGQLTEGMARRAIHGPRGPTPCMRMGAHRAHTYWEMKFHTSDAFTLFA